MIPEDPFPGLLDNPSAEYGHAWMEHEWQRIAKLRYTSDQQRIVTAWAMEVTKDDPQIDLRHLDHAPIPVDFLSFGLLTRAVDLSPFCEQDPKGALGLLQVYGWNLRTQPYHASGGQAKVHDVFCSSRRRNGSRLSREDDMMTLDEFLPFWRQLDTSAFCAMCSGFSIRRLNNWDLEEYGKAQAEAGT